MHNSLDPPHPCDVWYQHGVSVWCLPMGRIFNETARIFSSRHFFFYHFIPRLLFVWKSHFFLQMESQTGTPFFWCSEILLWTFPSFITLFLDHSFCEADFEMVLQTRDPIFTPSYFSIIAKFWNYSGRMNERTDEVELGWGWVSTMLEMLLVRLDM